MTFDNLLGGPPPTYLPEDPAAAALAAGDRRRPSAPGPPGLVPGLGHLGRALTGRRRRPRPATRSRGWATTVGSTPCAATDGRVTGRSRGSTSRTRASCAAWPRWPRPPSRSARPTRRSAAATFLTDSDPSAPQLTLLDGVEGQAPWLGRRAISRSTSAALGVARRTARRAWSSAPGAPRSTIGITDKRDDERPAAGRCGRR